MASTVTPATATVQIVESLTLGGVDRGGTHTRTINNVAEADRRVMTIDSANEIDIRTEQQQRARKFIVQLFVTFESPTWTTQIGIRVQVQESGAETADVKVDAGATFMLSHWKYGCQYRCRCIQRIR
jgi:hypothetical protein